jgi:glycosyltransferase involved in cell wall biosynthesis
MDYNAIRYIVITPVRDEEAFMATILESMLAQTIRPLEWVIVNDGSSDGTARLIDQAAEQHSWIRAVHRPNRGFRKPGGGVVDAFNDGYAAVSHSDWDFIVKLDADLTLEPNYFEQCFARFRNEPQLGLGGGTICYLVDGVKEMESTTGFHVRGATKIYRKACWDAIGGLISAEGWDTFDEIKANSLGWKTRSFPELHLVHHRKTGAADGHWKRLLKYGRANYICGYHPCFLLAKCLVRIPKNPYLLGSALIFYGFLSGYLRRLHRPDDPQAINYLRREQMRCLLGQRSLWR